ncbi:DNA damage-inducible protein D [Ligaoa zhengdingensis]|uniref:DNA damage-inducible protein D n=1 Tax=Ligaoa zhengdingensis TaxID=2763658 RepID=UPI00206A46DB|nr:MAG TPA: DNA-damage-inducible protein D [Caudoviricetes sp.]
MSNVFESIRHISQYQVEYWSARELYKVLEYTEYGKFKPVIQKAMEACANSGIEVFNHFAQVSEMINIANGAKRKVENYHLSRYACYLIVQNADPSKEVVATGQTYFAIQTRKQELAEEFDRLNEDERRLQLRSEMKHHNVQLMDAAKDAGVSTTLDYAIFQNHGYMGLYGGMDAKAIHTHKGLKPNEKILDNMGSTELAANLFRATQTEEKLRREHINGKRQANQTHYEVGTVVRKTIEELGGTMPEDLPKPDKSIQQLERDRKKLKSGE